MSTKRKWACTIEKMRTCINIIAYFRFVSEAVVGTLTQAPMVRMGWFIELISNGISKDVDPVKYLLSPTVLK